ncbi:hypothetical protein D3C74_428240 [compost metagenome]
MKGAEFLHHKISDAYFLLICLIGLGDWDWEGRRVKKVNGARIKVSFQSPSAIGATGIK